MPDDFRECSDVTKYNIDTGESTILAPLPATAFDAGCAADGDFIYVVATVCAMFGIDSSYMEGNYWNIKKMIMVRNVIQILYIYIIRL